jgi:hypothetical protein
MKYIKIHRALMVAVILGLLVAISPSRPVLAQTIALSLPSGTVGTTVYVSGSAFTPSTTVYLFFGSQPVTSFNTGTGTFFTPFTIPLGITPGFYTVTIQTTSIYTPANILATAYFTVTARQITITPTSGYVGSTVTVSGSGFNPSSTVTIYFDTTAIRTVAATASGSFSGATFTVPESYRGTHTIKGKDAGGDSLDVTFTTLQKTTVSQTSGVVGDQVTLDGTGFTGTSNITFYWDNTLLSASATTNANGSFTNNTFTIPSSSRGSHTIKAQDANGNYATIPFTIGQKITFAPTSGTVGAEVTVSGNGFEANEDITITFAGTVVTTSPASITTNSEGSFSASFNVPASASGTHEVKASDGTNEDGQAFAVSATASISQTGGYVGDEVTFSGSGFQAQKPIIVTFYNEDVATASTDIYGNLSLSFTVPPLAAGTYLVEVSDGINTKEAYFEIRTSASISPVTSAASPGHVGTDITVSGIGFIAGRTVTISYDGTQVATATVNTDGTFSATFKAAVSTGGEHSVIATDGTITQQLAFLMESTPPSTVYPQLPLMDSKLEKWRFDWCGDATDLTKEVTDLSLPITYTLQVATEEDFSLGSLVLEKTGLTESEYTIIKEERLKSVSKETPYYWRVKAIDAASNESQWSGTGSFYVGFTFSMPQPVIYTLLGVGALLLGVLGFWLGRKTAYVA